MPSDIAQRGIQATRKLRDPVITKGGDAGRLESEVEEIVFNPEVSDYEYFLSRKRYFERLSPKRDNDQRTAEKKKP